MSKVHTPLAISHQSL
ncbi:BnaA02g21740D [Brassica napus]|uniref:BnaA02g21740D protein n=1 Tax=Brassica napus TaxID=3708 RepID=A0A078GJB5_BRANA|nr:BnaA02g21740D [Brassica napus]